MTSRISFFKLCLENMKRRTWLLVLTILTYFISMPLAMMLMIQNEQQYESVGRADYEEIFSSLLGMGFHTILAAGFAILCAIAGFAWLFSKKKVDMYHSMPVRREKIFAAVYLNGVLAWLIPYLTGTLIAMLILSRYLTFTGHLLSIVMMTVGLNILFFLFFYNVMMVAVMLTGNMINCLMTGGVLFLYAAALRALLEVYLQCFMVTRYANADMLEEIRFASPLFSAIYFMNQFTAWKADVLVYVTGGAFALYLLQCAVLTVIAGVAALLLYQKRPSEAAGKSVAFEKILNIYRVLLVIPLSLASGIFFLALVSGSSQGVQTAWLIFGLVFGLVLSHGFIEVLFQMDIRAMFSYKKQLLATGVVVFLVAFSFKGDWYGMDRYLPKQEKIASMAVTAGLDDRYIYYNNYTTHEYMSGEEYILDNMVLTDFDAAYGLAKLGMDNAGAWRRGDDWLDDNAQFLYYEIRYDLKNGKEEIRRYRAPLDDVYPYLEQLYADEEYRNGMMNMFWKAAEEATCLYIEDFDYNSQELKGEQIAEFIEIYQREYQTLTAEQILTDSVVATFGYAVEERGSVISRTGNAPIFACCAETIQYLEACGMDKRDLTDTFNIEEIESLELHFNSDEDYEMVFGTEAKAERSKYGYITTDKEQIEKLLPYLVRDLDAYTSYKAHLYYPFEVYINIVREDEEHSEWVYLRKGASLDEISFEVKEE